MLDFDSYKDISSLYFIYMWVIIYNDESRKSRKKLTISYNRNIFFLMPKGNLCVCKVML